MGNNGSISLRYLEQIASGDMFDSWLTQTLETASIAATEAVLVTRDYRIPVAFRIYESEKNESEDSLIAYEVQEYSLWSAIIGAFGWPTSKELMTNSRLKTSIRYPEFISSAASMLNKDNLFNYLREQLERAPLSGRSPPAIEESVVSGHIFSKSAQTLSMAGIKLRNQDIYIKLSGRGESVLDDLYISIYKKHANHAEWLCAVATHVNRSMTFLRINSAQDDDPTCPATTCPVATATSEHNIWVSHLAGEEASITVTLVDRWQLLSINISVPAALSESKQLDVTVRTSTGRATRYPITVPPKFHGAQDWPFYVATYINHRVDGLAYGILQDNGTIVATRPANGYRIFAWHDSEINGVDFKIVEKPLAQWLNPGNHRFPTAQIKADSVPTATLDEVPTLSIWEALNQADGKTLDARPYLEQLIRRCLASAGLDSGSLEKVQFTDTLVFKYVEGNTGFVYAAGAASAHLKSHKLFTVLQVALGEPERQRSVWEREIDVYSKNGLINKKMIGVIKSIRNKLSDEFYKDLEKLSSEAEFKKVFATTCRSIAMARVALYFDSQPTSAELSGPAADYLVADLAPQLVLLNHEVVPSLIALTRGSDTALLVSLNPALPNATTVFDWNSSQGSDTYLKRLLSFIEPHLSLSQQLLLTIDDLRTWRVRIMTTSRFVVRPRLSFQFTPNWEASLRLRAIVQAKSDMNFLVFTSREQYVASRLRLRQTALRAVSAIVAILLPPTLGVSALVVNTLTQVTINSIGLWSSVELANNADRSTDYERYIKEGKLGALLLAAELIGDASSLKAPVGRLVRQISGLARTAIPAITDKKKPVPALSEDLVTVGLYFQPTSNALAPLVADLVRCFERSESQLAIAGWVKWPHGNAYDASSLAKLVMEADGWAVEVLGVLMFDPPSSELPAHHFALLAEKSGTQIVVDLTMPQYGSSNVRRAYAGSLVDWASRFATLEKNATRVLLYKRYTSSVAASDNMGGWVRGGVAGGSRFIDSASYTVAHFPASFADSVDKQLNRLWASLNSAPGTGASQTQTDSLKQVSHLVTLRSSKENELRQRIGFAQVTALRKFLLERHHNATQTAAQLQLKVEADIEVEGVNVERVTKHLNALKLSTLVPPSPPDPQALASAVAWLVASSLATRSNSDVIARVVQSYVTGDLKTFVFYNRSTISALHKELVTNPDNLAAPALRSGKLPTVISSRGLQDSYLKQLENVTVAERGERLFAIVVCCQVYEKGNELLARTLYVIETLRQQRFVKLTVSHEQNLAGITVETANPSSMSST